MPFTVAHAAAALPLRRAVGGRLVLSALVVGTMSPDFEYLAYLNTHRTISHTLPGLVLMCLPLSLAVLAVWHGVVKRPLAGLLPDQCAPLAAAAQQSFAFRPWRRLWLLCVSVLVGAFTHLVWDAFTHSDGWFVVRAGVLRWAVPPTGMPAYEVLQLLSSVVGMLAVLVALHRWAVRQPRRVVRPPLRVEPPGRCRRAAGAAWILGAAAAAALVNLGRYAGYPHDSQDLLTAALLGALTGSAVASVAYSVASRLRWPRHGT